MRIFISDSEVREKISNLVQMLKTNIYFRFRWQFTKKMLMAGELFTFICPVNIYFKREGRGRGEEDTVL